ncbi:MAG: class I SAM-dependent methyltransferase [Xanthobacteraceae bacterium]
MKFPQSLPRLLTASSLAAVVVVNVALAQQVKGASTPAAKAPASEYQPTVGQEGKDVVWVPTPQALVDKMLDMAQVTPNDYVIDLGSGDGRTVITAAKRGVKAHGIEYNPDMVALSKKNAEQAGVTDKATFVRGDIFESDFSKATVITLFLLPSLNQRLRPLILDMKPGTRVVSNTFDMGDWPADQTVQATGDCSSYCRAYFWMVPAKVEGKWKLPAGELALEQKYQSVSGSLTADNVNAPVNGKLIGDQITFTAGRTVYIGRVGDNTIEGTARSGDSETKWQATRAPK